jgi:DNA polymerase-3 subunit delta'
MGFNRFSGNAQTLTSLRRMLAAGRLPPSLILAGPQGVGKHTLASMIARVLNCLDDEVRASGDFCELCSNCRRIAPTESPESDEEFEKLLTARAKMKAEDRRERPLMFSSHPDVVAFLPDGPLRQISIDQARTLKDYAQFLPASGRRRVIIVDEADRMDAAAANSMLKVLEEPPETTVLILTATNYYELLPTIRSRGIALHLSPVAPEDVEKFPCLPRHERRRSQTRRASFRRRSGTRLVARS